MNALFIINTENGQYYYELFYQLSFLVGFLFFLYEGIRQKHPLTAWVLISAITIVFFIAGTKIGTYGLEEWKYLWTNWQLPETYSKTSLGGLLAGLLGIWVAKSLLRFKPSVLDGYALAIPAALLVQRFGCLLAGCCFGTTTTLPWGVQYSHSFMATEYHKASGWIETEAACSLPIHPVPIYMILAFTAILFVLWKVKDRIQTKGSLALLGLALLFGLRFFVEFFREATTNHALGETMGGLKEVQWVLLGLSLGFAIVVGFRERFAVNDSKDNKTNAPSLPILISGTFVLIALVWWAENWFSPLETLVVHAKLFIVLAAAAIAAFHRITLPRFRLATLGLIALAIAWMGQTYVPEKKETEKVTTTVTLKGLAGNADLDFYETKYTGSGCDRSISRSDSIAIGMTYMAGLGYQKTTEKKPGKKGVFGLGMHFSTYDREGGSKLQPNKNTTSFGGYMMGGLDKEFGGFRVGLHLGANKVLSDHRSRVWDEDIVSCETQMLVFPILHVRMGSEDLFFIDAGIGDDLPLGILTSRYRAGAGIAIKGTNSKGLIRFGYANHIDGHSLYLTPEIHLKDQFVLSPTVRIAQQPYFGLGMSFAVTE